MSRQWILMSGWLHSRYFGMAEKIEVVRMRAEHVEPARALLRRNRLSSEGIEEPAARFWVALEDGQVVGVAGLEGSGEDVLLRSVAVAPRLQGRGAGSRLVRAVLREAREAGARRAYLFSTGAGAFWAILGFREVPVPELVAAVGEAPMVRLYADRGWLDSEVAWVVQL